MAINLNSFDGDIVLKSNTFTKNFVRIDGCTPFAGLNEATPATNDDIVYIPTATHYQIKNLILIRNHPKLFVLGENNFTENVGMKGIVMVESTKQKQYPFIIVGNTFTYNSGFLYSDTLYLRVKTDTVYNPDLVQTSHY